MTALVAATPDGGPPAAGSHAGAKAVLALAAANVWLISAFHGVEVRIGRIGVAARLRTAARVCKGGISPNLCLNLEKLATYAKSSSHTRKKGLPQWHLEKGGHTRSTVPHDSARSSVPQEISAIDRCLEVYR